MDKKHSDYMALALEQAEKASSLGEIPVGCVIVRKGEVIATGYNTREQEQNPLCHAEIIAINTAAKAIGSWRLNDCRLYVTLEPCPMCMGAILNARIPMLVYGASDGKAGCCGGIVNLNEVSYPHRVEILAGISEEKCSSMLKQFFNNLR